MTLENATPTILTAAQLPTRQAKQRPRRTGPDTSYDELVFGTRVSSGSSSSSSLLLGARGNDGPLLHASWLGGEDDSEDSFTEEPIDEQEIYDLIASISDPEHPLSLGQLAVVTLPDIHITPSPSSGAAAANPDALVRVRVDITPTVNHCSLATIIGLAVRVRLEQALSPNYRVEVRVKQGSHAQDDQVTKQLADKERVVAALENKDLKRMLETMLATCA